MPDFFAHPVGGESVSAADMQRHLFALLGSTGRVVDGFDVVTSPGSLNVTFQNGIAIVLKGSNKLVTVGVGSGGGGVVKTLTANESNHVWIKADGNLHINITGAAPADAEKLFVIVTNGSGVPNAPTTGNGQDVRDATATMNAVVEFGGIKGSALDVSLTGNFTLTQNGVAVLTSVNAGAVANTLYLSAGKVGVGAASGGATLGVTGSFNVTGTTGNVAMDLRPTANSGGAATLYGILAQPVLTATAAGTPMWFATIGGSDQGGAIINTSGLTHPRIKGLEINFGNVTKSGGGTITDAFALYLAAGTWATNNYALYVSSGTSYFGSNVGIGATNPFVGLLVSVSPSAGSPTLGAFYGANLTAGINNAEMIGLQVAGNTYNINGKTGVNAWGVNLGTFAATGALNAYGLHITTPTGATNNYALYVASGASYFGGIVGHNAPPTSSYAYYMGGTYTASSALAVGMYAAPSLTAAANGDDLVGIRSYLSVNVNGKTGVKAYGIHVNTFSAATASNYGIHIDGPTGATNNYALYVASGTSYFGGNVGIGVAPLDRVGLFITTSPTSAVAATYGLNLSPNLTAGANGLAHHGMALNPTVVKGAFTGLDAYGLSITMLASGAGTITNAYGIHVTGPTIGTTNYALYVASGKTILGDNTGVGPGLKTNLGGFGTGVGVLTVAQVASSGSWGVLELVSGVSGTTPGVNGITASVDFGTYDGSTYNRNARIGGFKGDDNDDGYLGFATRKTGGSLTEVMRLIQAGSVSTTGDTAMLLYVKNNGGVTLATVTLGAADSGGAGYRALRVPN